MQKHAITFDEQEILAVQEIGDIIFVMVYPKVSNPIENIRNGCKIVPHMFYDHTLKYSTMQWDKKRRTPEEIVRLINAYLPKEWALVLVNLSTSVQAITEEGFMESRILTLDGNGQRSQKLSDWICEHEGVQFQYPFEETTEAKEPTRSSYHRSTTPDMETFVRMGEECSEEYVDIPDSSRGNVEKKSRRKRFGSDDFTTEESIGHIEAYHTESGEQVEASDKTALKAILTSVKRKRIGTPIINTEQAVQNKLQNRHDQNNELTVKRGKRRLFQFCLQWNGH